MRERIARELPIREMTFGLLAHHYTLTLLLPCKPKEGWMELRAKLVIPAKAGIQCL